MRKLLCILSAALMFGGGMENAFAINNTSTIAAIPMPVASTPLSTSYYIENSWPGGYQVVVTLRNPSSQATKSWKCTFSLLTNQTISSLWNGVDTVNGQSHTVTNPTWTGGGIIPPGGSTTFGMIIQNPNNGLKVLSSLSAVADADAPAPTVPSAPLLNAIVVSPAGSNNYTVSWNAVANATSYTLQQSTTSNFSNPTTVVQGNVTSQAFTGQPAGVYYYRVNASNANGTGPYSNIRSVQITSTITLTAPVLSAISNPSQSSQFDVQWSAVTNATAYRLEQSTSSNFSSPTVVTTTGNTSYTVSGLASGTYFYRVIATAGTSASSPSNVEQTVVNVQPVPSLEIPFIDSYWESWSQDPISGIVDMKVDVISISFGNFRSTGSHTFEVSGLDADDTTVRQFITAAHAAGKKVKISIGGATYPIAPQLQTNEDAIGMANAIISYIQSHELDGVDLDIEDYPAPSLQISMIQRLRQSLGPNALISYTPKTPASTTFPYNEVIQGAHTYLTSISFMAYDYGPGYTYQQDVSGLLAFGVPASKIVIGLMPGLDDVGVTTSLVDIESAANYVVQNNLGGLMFWSLNRDYSNQTGLGASAATNTTWTIFNP